MLRLLPVEGSAQQLPETFVGSDRDHDPVENAGQAVGNEVEPSAPDRRQHMEKDEGAVSGKKVEQAQEQQQLREHRIKAAGRREHPHKIEQPEYRVEETGKHGSADEE